MLTFVGNFPISTVSGQQNVVDVTPGPTPGSFLVAMAVDGDNGFVHRVVRVYNPDGTPRGGEISLDSGEAVGLGAGSIRIKMLDDSRFAVVWYSETDQRLYSITSDLDASSISPKRVVNTPGFFTSTEAPGSFIQPSASTNAGYSILTYSWQGFAVVWGNDSYATNYGTGATDDAAAYIRSFDYNGGYTTSNLPVNYLGSENPADYPSYGLVAENGPNGGYGIAFNVYDTLNFTTSVYFTAFDGFNGILGTPVLAVTPTLSSVKSISGSEIGYKITHNSADLTTWHRTYIITPSFTVGASSSTSGRSLTNGEYYRVENIYVDPDFVWTVILSSADDDQIDIAYADPLEQSFGFGDFIVGNSRIVVCGTDPATLVPGVGSGSPNSYQAQVSVYDASIAQRRAVFFR